MRTIILTFIFFWGLSSQASEQAMCMESGQNSALILADYSDEKVVLKYTDFDGNSEKEVTLKKAEVDLELVKVKSEEGEDLLIIHSMDFRDEENPQIIVLVCSL